MQEICNAIKSLLPSSAIKAEILAFFASLGALLSYALGGMDKAIYALIALAMLDYLTGMWAGWRQGILSSDVGVRGIAKKMAMFGVIAFAAILDVGMKMNILRDMAIVAYSANEGISIIENADRGGLGRYIPTFLRNKIANIKDRKIDGGGS